MCRIAVENKHLHAWSSAIGRRGHIGVVASAEVLPFGPDAVILAPTSAEIRSLRVSGRLIKSGIVIPVMQKVVHKAKLHNRGFLLIEAGLRPQRCVVGIVKGVGAGNI